MNLIKLGKRHELAKKGLSLLEMKRDALMNEFLSKLDEGRSLGSELDDMLEESYKDLASAYAIHGMLEMKAFSTGAGPLREIELETKNIMGVRVPTIKSVYEVGVSLVDTIHGSVDLDRLRRSFEYLSDVLLRYGELSETLKRLSEEIKRTNRKTKALENVVIPTIEMQRKMISMHLEELEREDVFRLKMVKRKKLQRVKE